jgi:hypothetical protein
MTVTIKDFFEDYNLLINEVWINWDDRILPIVESIINLSLVEQCPKSKLPSNPKTYVILESTIIKKQTLLKILETFDRVVLSKKEWLNIEKNPNLEIYGETQIFIDKFRFMIIWLIN